MTTIHPRIAADALVHETRYLRFYLRHQLKKTNVYTVYSRNGAADVLGIVRWFGKWRQYAFYPEPGTIYNSDCLAEINDFVKTRMAERKNG